MTAAPDTAALVARLPAGGAAARSALIARTCERLQHLTRRMLKGYPQVGRWEQTDDVLQNALLWLCRALEATPPGTVRHFYNLAALQVRRELLDLADRHAGPLGGGANHDTDHSGSAVAGAADPAGEPSSVEAWADFHRHVGALPADEREAFGLLWYGGLTQDETAGVLGVSARTVKRRWQAARLALAGALGDGPGGP